MRKIITGLLLIGFQYSTAGFLGGSEPEFTAREIHSLKLARKWMKNRSKSFRGSDGSVKFVYGATMPSIIAAPLRITDIQLQPGEIVREVQMGDKVRWVVSPSISGKAPSEVSHIIVKPTDVGLRTSMAIFTDRRTYHLNLISSKKRYMPIVGFAYQDEIDAKWNAYRRYVNSGKKAKEFKIPGSSKPRSIDNLDFSYRIDGNYYWKPTRVYSDGRKTYIQLPLSVKARELPVLMVLDNDGKKLVNYRVKNNTFIVDKLFKQAVLIMGVGSSQEKIIMTHLKASRSRRAVSILRSIGNEDNEW